MRGKSVRVHIARRIIGLSNNLAGLVVKHGRVPILPTLTNPTRFTHEVMVILYRQIKSLALVTICPAPIAGGSDSRFRRKRGSLKNRIVIYTKSVNQTKSTRPKLKTRPHKSVIKAYDWGASFLRLWIDLINSMRAFFISSL